MNAPDGGMRTGNGRRLAIVASVVAIATVVAALMVMDPPGKQREARIDQRRVRDLDRIDTAARLHLREHGTLPADLAALAATPGLQLAITDPVDDSAYGYEVTGPRSLRLCARFATDTAGEARASEYQDRRGWYHPAGRHCFDRRFDESTEE